MKSARVAPVLALSAAAAMAATALPAAAATSAAPAAAKKPAVSMEAVLLASQLDPGRPGNGTTSGAKASVLQVEKALVAKKLLAKKYADGSYGSLTVKAMARWQKKLGAKGCNANGIPGPSSLTKLGAGRFTVTRKISVGSTRAAYGGKRVNTRTKNMLAAADGKVRFGIRLLQGSYNPGGVGASGGTHDCGGAVDIAVNGLSSAQRWQLVKALRTVGFAAWYRPKSSAWTAHVHGIAINDPDLAPKAQPQVSSYYRGRDGLAKQGPDNTPKKYRVKFTTWEKYRR